MSRRRRASRFDKPDIPIGPILENYGFDLSRVRSSGWSAVKCAFHDDTHSSASVNLGTNHFCCWVGCTDRTEDTIGLIQHVEHVDFRTAKREAEEIAGVSGDAVRGKPRKRRTVLDEPWD